MSSNEKQAWEGVNYEALEKKADDLIEEAGRLNAVALQLIADATHVSVLEEDKEKYIADIKRDAEGLRASLKEFENKTDWKRLRFYEHIVRGELRKAKATMRRFRLMPDTAKK